MCRNPALHVTWRLYGRVELSEEGAERDEGVAAPVPQAEIYRGPERKGLAVALRAGRLREGTRAVQGRQGTGMAGEGTWGPRATYLTATAAGNRRGASR